MAEDKPTDFWVRYNLRKVAARESSGFPKMSDSSAVISIALTTIILAYSGFIGGLSLLVMFGLWLPLAYYKKRIVLRLSRDCVPVVALVAFALLSILWSDYPKITLRAAMECAAMLACTLIMSRLTSTTAFLKGLSLGAFTVLVLLFGMVLLAGISTVEILGSKNQQGLFAEIGLYAAILCLWMDMKFAKKLIFGWIPAAFCAFCLATSHSAGASASLLLALGAVIALYFMLKLPKSLRFFVALVAFLLMLPILYLLISGDFSALILQNMGRDSTLTGRTDLWKAGLNVGLELPLGGHGYAAFWVPGNPLADRYWYEAHENIGAGFHFHNLLIQTFVDLGLVGSLLMAFILLAGLVKSLRNVLRDGLTPISAAYFGFAFMFCIRGIIEVDILGPFGIGFFLAQSLLPRMAEEARSAIHLVPCVTARIGQSELRLSQQPKA